MLSRSLVLLAVLLVGVCSGISKKRFRDALGIKKLPKVSAVFRQKVQLLDGHIHGDDGMHTGGDDDEDIEDINWDAECPAVFEIYQHMNESGCLDDGTPLGDNFTEADAATMDVEAFCFDCNATDILDMVHNLDDSCYNDSEALHGLSMILPIFGAMCTQNATDDFCVAKFFMEMWLEDDDDDYHSRSKSMESPGDGPECTVDEPERLGDGFCDGFDYNTEQCGWDGGDCCEQTCVDTTNDCSKNKFDCIDPLYSSAPCLDDPDGLLSPQQNPDKDCAIAASNRTDWSCDSYDDEFQMHVFEICPLSCGACSECTVDEPERLGDGFCDGFDYNTEQCAWDGGDCCEQTCVDDIHDCASNKFDCMDPLYSSGGSTSTGSYSSSDYSDSDSSEKDDDEGWWDLLCEVDDGCPWEQRLVDHQFDCNADLFIFTTLCVRDQERYCVNTVTEFLESGDGHRMPTQYDHEYFCSDPCAGAVIEDMYADGMQAPECINGDEIPIDLSFACYQNNGTYCLPHLYGDMAGDHAGLNCTLGDPEDIANWEACDAACVSSVEDMYEEYGCCADIFFEVEFGHTWAPSVADWIESECGVSPPPGDNCFERYEAPRDTPECKELRGYDVDVLGALKCLVNIHDAIQP